MAAHLGFLAAGCASGLFAARGVSPQPPQRLFVEGRSWTTAQRRVELTGGAVADFRVSLPSIPRSWITAFFGAIFAAAGATVYSTAPGWITTQGELEAAVRAHDADPAAHGSHQREDRSRGAQLEADSRMRMRVHRDHVASVLRSLVGIAATQRLDRRHYWRCRKDVSRLAQERFDLLLNQQKRAGGWDAVALEVIFEQAASAQIARGCH